MIDESLDTFLSALASGEATPGGGSAAALAGALGAALAAMVARLTAGKKRFASVDAQMQGLIEEADALQIRLTSLMDADAEAYQKVMRAYRLPRDSEAAKIARQQAIQEALKGATQPPKDTMRACLDVLRLASTVAFHGNPNALSDAAVSALLAHAGQQGAALNVRINIASIRDDAFVAASQSFLEHSLDQGADLFRQVMAQVEKQI
jgi:formiminotetrahydrofolate cyclodeaminase